MKIRYCDFINEELKHLPPPSDEETLSIPIEQRMYYIKQGKLDQKYYPTTKEIIESFKDNLQKFLNFHRRHEIPIDSDDNVKFIKSKLKELNVIDRLKTCQSYELDDKIFISDEEIKEIPILNKIYLALLSNKPKLRILPTNKEIGDEMKKVSPFDFNNIVNLLIEKELNYIIIYLINNKILDINYVITPKEDEKFLPMTILRKTFLHSDNFELIEFLIKNGADPNKDIEIGNAISPLMYTIYHYNSFHLIKLLIEHGANVNAKNDKGVDILYYAVSNCNLEIVKYLVEHGADVNYIRDNRDTDKYFRISQMSAYSKALYSKKFDIAVYLRKKMSAEVLEILDKIERVQFNNQNKFWD